MTIEEMTELLDIMKNHYVECHIDEHDLNNSILALRVGCFCLEHLEIPIRKNKGYQILEETEKKYLSAVIKPLKTKDTTITKENCGKTEMITIDGLKRLLASDGIIWLPPFEKGTMYKGMIAGRDYTLEELGL